MNVLGWNDFFTIIILFNIPAFAVWVLATHTANGWIYIFEKTHRILALPPVLVVLFFFIIYIFKWGAQLAYIKHSITDEQEYWMLKGVDFAVNHGHATPVVPLSTDTEMLDLAGTFNDHRTPPEREVDIVYALSLITIVMDALFDHFFFSPPVHRGFWALMVLTVSWILYIVIISYYHNLENGSAHGHEHTDVEEVLNLVNYTNKPFGLAMTYLFLYYVPLGIASIYSVYKDYQVRKADK